jgi:hypothetical protein
MVRVAAAGGEAHGAIAQSASLALNAGKIGAVIDHKVVPRVLPERNEEGVTRALECEHDG